MGLRAVNGKKIPADYTADRHVNVNDPKLLVYSTGKAQVNIRCADLVAITGASDPVIIQKVAGFAESVPNDDSWTKEQVAELCKRVGRMPFPEYVRVEHLEGQGTLLIQVVGQKGPGVTGLSYAKRSNRPTINILPALRDESINIPEGMCLEVPVALVMDEGQLKVEANLRKGEERAVKQREGSTGDDTVESDEAGDEETGD